MEENGNEEDMPKGRDEYRGEKYGAVSVNYDF